MTGKWKCNSESLLVCYLHLSFWARQLFSLSKLINRTTTGETKLKLLKLIRSAGTTTTTTLLFFGIVSNVLYTLRYLLSLLVLHAVDVKLVEENLHPFLAVADKVVGAADVRRIRMRVIGRGEGAIQAAVRAEPSITGAGDAANAAVVA